MYEEYCKNPERFIAAEVVPTSQREFEEVYSVELRDFNSAGVVAANQGIPMSRMDKNKYEVYGEQIQVAKEQRDLCKKTIEDLVNKL